jgi:hypothetical protein
MLFARFAVAKIAVVRQIDQDICALAGKLPDQSRKRRFITNKHAQPLAGAGGEYLDVVAGNEIACFLADAIYERKEMRDVLPEWDEIDLVVAADFSARGTEQHSRIERLSLGRVGHRAE